MSEYQLRADVYQNNATPVCGKGFGELAHKPGQQEGAGVAFSLLSSARSGVQPNHLAVVRPKNPLTDKRPYSVPRIA